MTKSSTSEEQSFLDDLDKKLVTEPNAQCAESAKLEQAIKANLERLGYGV